MRARDDVVAACANKACGLVGWRSRRGRDINAVAEPAEVVFEQSSGREGEAGRDTIAAAAAEVECVAVISVGVGCVVEIDVGVRSLGCEKRHE